MKFRILFIILLIFQGLIWFGCSSDDSSTNSNEDDIITTQKNVGPLGDTLEIPGKVKLIIPAGALSESVTISITQNDSPTPVTAPNRLVAPVFSIEPTGTIFSTDAYLSINYNATLLGNGEENDIVIGCDTGDAEWDTLTTILNTQDNLAGAYIEHLSDFAVIADTSTAFTEGVFALFSVARTIANVGGFILVVDGLVARFDSAYAPCDTIKPLQADSVTCNEFTLTWETAFKRYKYGMDMFMQPFLVFDSSYTFIVDGNASVPSLETAIDFPSCEPTLVSPTYGTTVSKSGFDVTWQYVCGGNVRLILLNDNSDSTLWVETPNDGSYSFSEAQLTDLDPGEYGLLMIFENQDYISATGYDSRSFVMARVINSSLITLEELIKGGFT